MRRYIALIRSNPDGGLAARLPDFPKISGFAKTLDELRELLTAELAARVGSLQREGRPLPAPSSFEMLMADPENRDHAALLVWPPGATPEAARQDGRTDALNARSNDEWPEADA